MDLGLKGKVAAVMAASEGIGFGVARALAEEGCLVAICARRPDRLDEAAKTLRSETGAEVWTCVADVAKPAGPETVIDGAVAHFGQKRLDVLVNNGGGPKPGPTAETTDAQWRSAFELLVLSNVRASRAAFPHMKAHGGSITNIVSTSVKQPIENLVLSNSLRSAVVGLAKTLSLEWAPHKIRVNNVLPGSIATIRIEEILKDEAARRGISVADARLAREGAIPLGRYGTPLDLGRTVAFLASRHADYITGQSLSVDGGATRWVHG
ncbi:MAG: SDR family oxidoreductase [Euryarchaeota archaeon]|nr:SDR family oxidoreductase [Euryarchaeota archaeon]